MQTASPALAPPEPAASKACPSPWNAAEAADPPETELSRPRPLSAPEPISWTVAGLTLLTALSVVWTSWFHAPSQPKELPPIVGTR